MIQLEFDPIFKALTGYNPLRWQKRLYEKLLSGDVPASIDLPTGIGKTSIIVIWLIAFAVQAITRKAPCLPRRLIYIVNRRTVVDQATQIAEKIRKRLLGQEEVSSDERAVLDCLKEALQQVAAIEKEPPLAISTLRGELADNEEWKADPTRPAIIIGTIDMIGSKLLFSGYGDSYRMRPHHAGLIGQDAIIIHDEAHLTPAFSELLHAVRAEQLWSKEPRPIRIIELSATQRKTQGKKFCLEEEDSQDDFVQTRLNAEKILHIHKVERGKLVENIVDRTKDYQSHRSKILIYVHSPEQAKEIVSKLKRALGQNGGDRVALLTGTIRGYERDQLLQSNHVFQAFMDAQSHIEETLYLVCTSAGEVGVDLYAHHLICDATTLESLIQRLGRVNRDGQHQAHIDLFVEEEEETQGPYLATVELLENSLPQKGNGFDVSPRALMELLNGLNDLKKEEVFSPKPKIIPVTDLLLDAWAMTSIREELPGRPSVAAYLHGIEAAPPETYLVWRSEVRFLAEGEISEDDIGEWFQHCRIESRERLRDLSNRVFKELKKLAERHKKADLPVLIIDDRGEAKRSSLQELVQGTEEAIRFRTIVLPAEAGGLTEEGILDGNAEPRNGLDILGHDGKYLRLIVEGAGGIYRYRGLSNGEEYTELDGEYKSINKAVRQISKTLSKSVSLILPLRLPIEGDEEATARYLVLLAEAKQAATDDPELASYESTPRLKDHLEVAAKVASQITESLGLSDSLKEAVIKAARLHDLGKDRKCWQSAVFNNNPCDPWAKSGSQGMDWRRLAGYRHEFGSLLDAKKNLDHEERDLILHLIAAHHGRARPHFEPDAWDMERHTTTENEDEAHEVMRRYARLQQRFGRWGLAWLESLVRCADVIASRQATQTGGNGR